MNLSHCFARNFLSAGFTVLQYAFHFIEMRFIVRPFLTNGREDAGNFSRATDLAIDAAQRSRFTVAANIGYLRRIKFLVVRENKADVGMAGIAFANFCRVGNRCLLFFPNFIGRIRQQDSVPRGFAHFLIAIETGKPCKFR